MDILTILASGEVLVTRRCRCCGFAFAGPPESMPTTKVYCSQCAFRRKRDSNRAWRERAGLAKGDGTWEAK
jgi:hypothetical protein